MEQVRVGIVGMGIGRPNARAIERNAKGRVVALCDLDMERMAKFAEEFDHPVHRYLDFHELCADDEVDAIFIGTPNQWHVPIGLEAVRNGKHVLITKPLADSVAAAEAMVAEAEASGVVNMMSLSTRSGAGVRYLKQVADDGGFGELYYGRARSIRRSGIPAWNTGFISAGGGAVRDMGVHVLDSAWWLMGMPEPVCALAVAGARFGPRGVGYSNFQPPKQGIPEQYDTDDYGGGFIRFANGAGLQIESFWASHQPNELQIELFGTDAGAQLNPLTIYQTVHGAPNDTVVNLPKGPEPWDVIAGHFLDCIADGIPCQAPLRHGLVVQRMLEALLESAEKGCEIRLRESAVAE